MIAQASLTIHAPAARVWHVLTDPTMIKQYLFGTDVHTDWQVGSPITYTGEWQGKTYEDKGVILQNIPEKLLESTYWSSMSGTEDKPENYMKVTYGLSEQDNETTLTITQDNTKTEEDKNHSEQNWKMVLEGIKKLAEEEAHH